MSRPTFHSKHYSQNKSLKEVHSRAPFGVRNSHRHRLLSILTGLMICITTLAFSPALADISNVVRFSCMAFMLMLGCLLSFYSRRVPITIGTMAFALFVLWQAVSIVWSTNKAEALFDVGKYVMVLFAVMFSYNLFRQHPVKAVVMMLYVSAIVCVVSLAAAVMQAVNIGDLSRAARYGIVSLFTHKGTYSMLALLTMAFPFMALRLRLKRVRLVSIVVILAQAGVLLFLQARAAWLADLAIIGMLLLLWPLKFGEVKPLWRMFCTLVVALLMGFVVVGGSRCFANIPLKGPDQREGLLSNASVYERQALWRMTFRMVDEKPFTGCGAGNWKVCYPKVSVRDVFSMDMLDFQFVRPHNDYLRILSESGYFSLALLLFALASLLVNGVFAAGGCGRYGKMAGITVPFLAGVLVFAIFDFPLDRIELLLWISILCGAVMAFSQHGRQIRHNAVSMVIGCIILTFILFVGCCHWHSEAFYPVIVDNIHQGHWKMVEQMSKTARNTFCNLTPMAVPYAYYEAMALENLHEPAIETFRMALQDSPYNKKILTDLGRLEYVEKHDVKQAIAYLEESIRISPAYSYAYFNLAQVYLLEGQKQKAAEILQQLDLDYKQQQMVKMVWHYHQDEIANYYVHDAVPAEKDYLDLMVEQIEALL